MSLKYANNAKQFMTSGNKGKHINDLADEIVKNYPNVKDPVDVIAKKLSSAFSSSIKRRKGEFLRVKNKQGGFKKGVYKLSKKQTQKVIKQPQKVTGISTGFVGKGGEHAVLSELLFNGYNASIMTVDDGIDIVASKNNKYFHIQVKTSSEKDNSFQFTIQKSAFKRHNNRETFYILLCRRYLKTHIQNDLIILPNTTINHYLSSQTIKNSQTFSLNILIEKSKYILNKNGQRKSDITTYVNDFNHLN